MGAVLWYLWQEPDPSLPHIFRHIYCACEDCRLRCACSGLIWETYPTGLCDTVYLQIYLSYLAGTLLRYLSFLSIVICEVRTLPPSVPYPDCRSAHDNTPRILCFILGLATKYIKRTTFLLISCEYSKCHFSHIYSHLERAFQKCSFGVRNEIDLGKLGEDF